jgi:hypothetical protein
MIGVGGPGIWFAAGFGEEGDAGGPQVFDLKGLSPEAKSIQAIKGTLRVQFPLEKSEVAFDDPETNAHKTHGDVAVKLEKVRASKNFINLKFTKSKGDVSYLKDEILGRMDGATVRAVDEDGKEHVGEIGPVNQENPGGGIVIMGGAPGQEGARSIQLRATFATLEGKELKRFSFKMAEALYEKVVPFEIRNVKLP